MTTGEIRTSAGSHTTEDGDSRLSEGNRVCILLESAQETCVASLGDGAPLTVGRSSPSLVVVRDKSLSRTHAKFWLEPDGEVWVEDLGSTNSTRLNGQKIERSRVRAGDEVLMGGVRGMVLTLAPREIRHYGVESHEQFLTALEHDLIRSRHFGRGLAVLMIQPEDRSSEHFSRWCPSIRRMLRPVDHLAWFGPGIAEVLVPETTPERVMILAKALANSAREAEGTPLFVGVAHFPGSATSAEELVELSRAALARASKTEPVSAAPANGARTWSSRSESTELIADSPPMRTLLTMIEQVAASEVPALIHGETGSGKEVVARTLHERSARREEPLHSLNCAAIPKELVESALFGHEKGAFTGATEQRQGIFEAAHGGTVFLDEIGELSPAAQAALLRVIESKRFTRVGSTKEIEVDIRIIAATHRDLEAMSADGSFRWDLYYRLNVITLHVPPLRQRPTDISLLAGRFLARANEINRRDVRGISPEAMEALIRYSWPGNVRELRNAIERAVVLARHDILDIDQLPEKVRTASGEMPESEESIIDDEYEEDENLGPSLKERMRRFEAQLIMDALARCKGNQRAASEHLKIPVRTLAHKMKLHGIHRTFGVRGED